MLFSLTAVDMISVLFFNLHTSGLHSTLSMVPLVLLLLHFLNPVNLFAWVKSH